MVANYEVGFQVMGCIYDDEEIRRAWLGDYAFDVCGGEKRLRLGEGKLVYSCEWERPLMAMLLDLPLMGSNLSPKQSRDLCHILFSAISARVRDYPCWVGYLPEMAIRMYSGLKISPGECDERLLAGFDKLCQSEGRAELGFFFPDARSALFIRLCQGISVYCHGSDAFWAELQADLLSQNFPVGVSLSELAPS